MFTKLDSKLVLAALDNAKISTDGWREIIAQLKEAADAASLAIKVKSTANPSKVDAERSCLDSHAKTTVLANVAKEVDDIELPLDTMIELAVGASVSAGVLKLSTLCADQRVIVLITLDETTWAGDKKLERVCIKIMNQMLATPSDVPIQSEHDVYPLCMFYVDKEDHATLKARLSNVNDMVKEFNSGRTLEFPGVDIPLAVDVHLAADLKTLHAIYDVHNSPSAHFQNLYDNVHHDNIGEVIDDILAGKRVYTAAEISLCKDLSQAALAIPLDKVHFCSMHAEMRLVEHVLNKMINDAWNCTNTNGGSDRLRVQKLEAITLVLRRLGVYGGKVKIREDLKRASPNGPSHHKKISMNGTMCRTLLDSNDGEWYKMLIAALSPDAARRVKLKECWASLSAVCVYLRSKILTAQQTRSWPSVVSRFLKAYNACYGNKYTRYMYLLGTVGSIFVQQYGGLAIFNAQAMEKSHWRAKCMYLGKTNKGGGKHKVAPLYQLTLISFRSMMHRMRMAAKSKEVRQALTQDVAHEPVDEAEMGHDYLMRIVQIQQERGVIMGELEMSQIDGLIMDTILEHGDMDEEDESGGVAL